LAQSEWTSCARVGAVGSYFGHGDHVEFDGGVFTAGGLVFLGLTDGTVAAFDDTTLEQLWKINVGSGFSAPPMTFEVNGKQYIAIASGPSTSAKAKLINTPELKEQRQATVLYVLAVGGSGPA